MSLNESTYSGENLTLDDLLDAAEGPQIEPALPDEEIFADTEVLKEPTEVPEEIPMETPDEPHEELPTETPNESCEEIVEESHDESCEEVPAKKLPGWVTLVPGIAIVATLFIFLFLLVSGVFEPSPVSSDNTGDTESTLSTESTAPQITEATVPTETLPETTIPPTAPADGNPDDITCQGSYSVINGTKTAADVVATVGDQELTNAQLQVYYWQEVYRYLAENPDHGISLAHTLDVQMCSISDTPMTWQQYFLQRAIETWHVYQALALDSDANDFGLDESYRAYLDGLPETLEQLASQMGYTNGDAMVAALAGSGVRIEDYAHYVSLYEQGHIYFDRVYQNTTPSDAEIEGYLSANGENYADMSGKYVDVRHIMLVPEEDTDKGWETCKRQAETLLQKWKRNSTDINFAEFAFENSVDAGSNNNGGLYSNVYEGLFPQEINDWCFEASRKKGDTAIFKTDAGYHIFYFSASHAARYVAAEQDLIGATVALLVPTALENFPISVDYGAIQIGNVNLNGLDAESISSHFEVLDSLCQSFPDGDYERYATIPLYLQQDYTHVAYGAPGTTVSTHGCGITAMAMLASYMTDTEQSVEEMVAMFKSYGSIKGTSRNLFDEAPIRLGFYMDSRVFTWKQVEEALNEGKLVISLQHKGRFTNGGHYLLLYELTEDGTVMIRDSNRLNYTVRFVNTDYYDNGFPASFFPPANVVYWVFEPKITHIAACARCGDTETEGLPTGLLLDTYYCPKCTTALHLREVYDTACDIDLLDRIVPPVIDEVQTTKPDNTKPDDTKPNTDNETKPTDPEDDELDTSTPEQTAPDAEQPENDGPDSDTDTSENTTDESEDPQSSENPESTPQPDTGTNAGDET